MPQRRRASARKPKNAGPSKLTADGLFVTDNLEGFGFAGTSNLVGAESPDMYSFFARLFESRTKKGARFFVTPLLLESQTSATQSKLIACGAFVGATDFTKGRTGFLAFGLCFTESALRSKKKQIIEMVQKLSRYMSSDFDTRSTLFDRISESITANASVNAIANITKVSYPKNAFIHKRAATANATPGALMDAIDTLLERGGNLAAVIGDFSHNQQNQLPSLPAPSEKDPLPLSLLELAEADPYDEDPEESDTKNKKDAPTKSELDFEERYKATIAKLEEAQDVLDVLRFSGFAAVNVSELEAMSKQLDRFKLELERSPAPTSELHMSSRELLATLFRRHRPLRTILLIVMASAAAAVPLKLFFDYLQNPY